MKLETLKPKGLNQELTNKKTKLMCFYCMQTISQKDKEAMLHITGKLCKSTTTPR